MIDKLHLKTDFKVDIAKLCAEQKNLTWHNIPDTIYKRALIARKEFKHILTLKTSPIWGHVTETQIQLNPNNWENFSHLKESLIAIAPLESMVITRIDHAVDLELPIEEVFQSFKVKYKQNGKTHHEKCHKRGVLTGFYIGSGHEIFCVYDKAYQLNKKKLTPLKGQISGVKTRIEIRHVKKKIAHTDLLTLPSYLHFPPFKNVEYLELNESNANQPKQDALRTLIGTNGLQETFLILNKQNNFKRNYSSYFNNINFKDRLNTIYWENLSHFLGGSNDNSETD